MNKCLVNKLAVLIVMIFTITCFINIKTSGAENPVELIPHWKKGEKHQLELIKMRESSQGDVQSFKATARTDIEVEVMEAHKNGYVLSWTHGETTFDNPEQAKNPVFKQMSNILKGLNIILDVDTKGHIKGVQNWKEIKKKSEKVINIITQSLRESGSDETMVEKMSAQIASMFSTREQIEMMSTREAGLYFLPLGKTYKLSSPVEYKDILTNPFGGEPFPSKAKLLLESYDRKNDSSIVKWQQTIDPEDAHRILKKTFQDLARRFGKPMPKESQLPRLDIKDTGEFTVINSTGWIQDMKHTRSTTSGPRRQMDSVNIRMKTTK